MNYRTRLDSLSKNISTLPIYEEQGYKIGTAKIDKDYVYMTIEKYQNIIQKLVEEKLLKVKEVRCTQMSYAEFMQKKKQNMKVTQGLMDGLILLARLHPKGKVSAENDRVTFYILAENSFGLTEADEKLLSDWEWVFIEYEEIEHWVYGYRNE